MNISLNHLPQAPGWNAAADALNSWYDSNPAVKSLWAVASERTRGVGALRIIVLLEPSSDGDETMPIWMARQAQWTRELSQRLARPVQLQRVDEPLSNVFEIDGGLLIAALSWRDPTAFP
jgi:hypothetical protein